MKLKRVYFHPVNKPMPEVLKKASNDIIDIVGFGESTFDEAEKILLSIPEVENYYLALQYDSEYGYYSLVVYEAY